MNARQYFVFLPLVDIIAKRGAKLGAEVWYNGVMKINIGKVIGVALFAGAVAAIEFWPEANVEAKPDDSVRPVRSVVAEKGTRLPDLYFTGKVKADSDRTLCFKQPGRIQRIPVAAGQRIKKGDRLAWLDPLDFEKDLAKAEAAEQRDRQTCDRKREAAKKNAISKEELSQAEAQLAVSAAQLALAKRALEDTVLLAPFDGTVAEVPATELDMVTPSTKIVLVHDLSKIKIDVVFPETMAIAAKKIKAADDRSSVCAVAHVYFDSVPGRLFPVKFVEYVSNADAKTQTYVATYVMDAPDDLMIMPGMSATLFIKGSDYRFDSADLDNAIRLPESAVAAAPDGSFGVWVLEPSAEKGVFAARHRTVELASRNNGTVTVLKGVKPGERIATAGVSQLTEGRKVRLLAE